jgi:hypothetical protein
MDFSTLNPTAVGVGASVVIAVGLFILGTFLGARFVLLSRTAAAGAQAGSPGAQQQRQQETTRASLAIGVLLAIIVTIGVLFLLMVLPIQQGTPPVNATVFSQTVFPALIGVFGTVCGFYFGGKQATESASQAGQIAAGGGRGPQLTVQTSAAQGSAVAISGSNFGPSLSITLTMTDSMGQTTQVGTGLMADANGSWLTSVQLEDGTPVGQVTFFATDSASNRAAAVLAVTLKPGAGGNAAANANGAVPGVAPAAVIMVFPDAGKPNTASTVMGSGFPPNSQVAVSLVDSSPPEKVLGNANSDGGGKWLLPGAMIPPNAQVGNAVIKARVGAVEASYPFNVQA